MELYKDNDLLQKIVIFVHLWQKILDFLPFINLICINIIIYFSLAIININPKQDINISYFSLFFFLGIIFCSILFAIYNHLQQKYRFYTIFVILFRLIILVFIIFVIFITSSWGYLYQNISIWLTNIGIFGIGMLIPLVLYIFFNVTPLKYRGILFGTSVSIGVLSWRVVILISKNIQHDKIILEYIRYILIGRSIFICLVVIILIYSFFSKSIQKKIRKGSLNDFKLPNSIRYKNIILIIIATSLFFILNGFLENRLFPIISGNSQFQFTYLHVLFIIVCPLVGLFIDINKQKGFKIIILFCATIFVFAPLLTVLDIFPLLYIIIHSFASIGHYAVLVSVSLILGQLSSNKYWAPLIYSLVFMLNGVFTFGQSLFAKSVIFNNGISIVASTVTAILFYVLIKQVSFTEETPEVMTISQDINNNIVFVEQTNQIVENNNLDNEKKIIEQTNQIINPVIQLIDNKLLTSREYEIAVMLLNGLSNREIAEKLFISEHTVKTHTGKIFIKYNVANRKELMAIFINGNK